MKQGNLLYFYAKNRIKCRTILIEYINKICLNIIIFDSLIFNSKNFPKVIKITRFRNNVDIVTIKKYNMEGGD